nr:MAG TPA_asm: hypothetical protein [Microviridae sp.]
MVRCPIARLPRRGHECAKHARAYSLNFFSLYISLF